MALLPLTVRPAAGEAIGMSHNDRRSSGKMQAVRHAARTVAAVIRECNYATSRLRDARIFPDIRAERGDRAPETYADFLWRSPVALWREPPARRRAVGACPHR